MSKTIENWKLEWLNAVNDSKKQEDFWIETPFGNFKNPTIIPNHDDEELHQVSFTIKYDTWERVESVTPQSLIDEAYESYRIAFVEGYIHEELDKCLSQEEFIEEIKTDKDFSEKWGLKIEERVLSLEERYDWFIKTYNTNLTRSSNQYNMEDILSSNNCPTKLITITYNDKTITIYE